MGNQCIEFWMRMEGEGTESPLLISLVHGMTIGYNPEGLKTFILGSQKSKAQTGQKHSCSICTLP